MSLILDALKRSDADRTDPDEVPGIHTRHVPDTARPDSQQRWPLYLLILALPLLLVLGWMQFADRNQQAAPPAVAPIAPIPAEIIPESSVQQVAPQQPLVEPAKATPAPQAAPVTSRAANTQQDAEVASLYASGGEIEESPTATETQAARAEQDRQEQAEIGAAELEEAEVREALDVEAVARAAQRELQAKPVTEHAVPLIIDLSQQQKDRIPTVFYNAHHWNGTGADNWVVLNGRKVLEGGSAGKGVQVEEILEDSSVLSYEDIRFRLRSLNSWVNL